jgi:alkanesulfonate monooxygenase SsuD/methylene tetrahydromethanopterin reductase-like flavin-dependent oxidoreductase (luciferase family)
VLQPIVDGGPSDRTSMQTAHYLAHEAPSTPGALQRPLPLTIAAGGAKGLRLAATYGRHWVTIGPTGRGPRTPDLVLSSARRQVELLDSACREAGRDPTDLGRVLLWTPTETIIQSLDQFDDLVAPYEELGFDQFVLHHPAQTGPYGGDVRTFEQIAERYAGGQ